MLKKKRTYIFLITLVLLFIFRNHILLFFTNWRASAIMNTNMEAEKVHMELDPLTMHMTNVTIMNPKGYGQNLKAIEAESMVTVIKPLFSFSKLYITHVYMNQVTVHVAGFPQENNLKKLMLNMDLPVDLYLDSLEARNITLNVYPPERHKKENPQNTIFTYSMDRYDIGTENPGMQAIKKDSLYNAVFKEGIFEIPENLFGDNS